MDPTVDQTVDRTVDRTINQEVPLDQIGLMAQKGITNLLKAQIHLQEVQEQKVKDCLAQALVEALGQLVLDPIL